MVTIEELDDERSIVTPDMRLRFRWVGDRWTHSIDIRPGPWQTLADAIEWSPEDHDGPARPTYQELHFQQDGDDVLALLVGQAGPHHFSASFRVKFRSYHSHLNTDTTSEPDLSESTIEVDVADRCRADGTLAAHYLVYDPPADTYLCDPDEAYAPNGFLPLPREVLVWEADVPGNYDICLNAMTGACASNVAIVGYNQETGDWHVRSEPQPSPPSATRRFGYIWTHNRINRASRRSDSNAIPPRS